MSDGMPPGLDWTDSLLSISYTRHLMHTKHMMPSDCTHKGRRYYWHELNFGRIFPMRNHPYAIVKLNKRRLDSKSNYCCDNREQSRVLILVQPLRKTFLSFYRRSSIDIAMFSSCFAGAHRCYSHELKIDNEIDILISLNDR
jgi:hypothetical protein